MKKEIGLRDLSKEELITLFGRRGAMVDQRDLRLVRHEHLCKKADALADEALSEMRANHGWENTAAYNAATRKFDQAMRIYDIAHELFEDARV